ncbi:sugar ABC transporter substrate-binding protein [Sporanaerobium hydrogeniformans]|uniref:Sugar ABC transporter substrate-binding protein n=1 Tax=Sporanaerobium hydrogeniformans TaxID=3072179 RepID=A0AC61DCE1_9FIRM|nr:substrate-binding domain-containing protein [Sporanaerobium hydrogeniformans]PHV70277.1 sugar ABC transporter substrate-binding protein [Sporanaerobium hydrogeniformans]
MKILKKVLLILMIAVVLYISLSRGVELKQNKNFSIIFIPKVVEPNNDFWNLVIEGASEAKIEYEIKLEVMAPEKEGSYEKQNEIILEAISKRPDAIILAAEDYEKTAPLAQKIKDNGIKLLIVDAGVKDQIEDVMIATNNFEAGIKMGSRIKKLLVDDGTVAIMSHSKMTSTAMQRESGIRVALNDREGRIVESYECGSDSDKAYENTIKAVKEHENLKVIAALNQYTSIGVARAIKDLNLVDQIKVVGFDNSKEQIKYLEEGIYDSITIQNPFYMGYISVEKAVKLLQGEVIEKNINTGSTLITKENMYIGMNQRLLFPF